MFSFALLTLYAPRMITEWHYTDGPYSRVLSSQVHAHTRSAAYAAYLSLMIHELNSIAEGIVRPRLTHPLPYILSGVNIPEALQLMRPK